MWAISESTVHTMIRPLIFLLMMPLTALSQPKSDYDIYSDLIINKILEWKVNPKTISSIVVTNSLTKFSLQLSTSQIIDEMIAPDNGGIYNFLHFYDQPKDILNNNEFKLLLNDFKLKLTVKTELKADSFNLKIPVSIVPKQKIEKIFRSKIFNSPDRSWRRFNKKYSTKFGYFEFSEIAYSENFAIVYVVHRVNPLNGVGGLEFLKKENGKWCNMANYAIWNN
jgi:hypothetical protein